MQWFDWKPFLWLETHWMIFWLEQDSLSPFHPFWQLSNPFLQKSQMYVANLGAGDGWKENGRRRDKTEHTSFPLLLPQGDLLVSQTRGFSSSWYNASCLTGFQGRLHWFFIKLTAFSIHIYFCYHLLNVSYPPWAEISVGSGTLPKWLVAAL